ncbi:porin [Hyphomicrobium sp. D-2]|uniref:porin n=1 Tax=Hyphomicrobium sp. D-2 TaxID=3041621 RepID=UPI002454F016|nr:porin [Hyphomicrobium sp. D-2]MDH4982992.1 porin [Hyphomicrobium sp. D-2]
MKKSSLGALVAAGLLAGGLSTGSASAADLGGNCCADLEERIAELEATTARKGNRKVSLTVSGWVGQQVMWWDDGYESNTYVGDLGATLSSHFKFTGRATISPGWYAGYVLHVEARNNNSLGLTQDYGNNGALVADGVHLLQSFWFVKSDQLGKISVGLQSQASDNTAILVDGSGSLVPANWVAFDYASFFIRDRATTASTGIQFIGVGGCRGGGAIGDCNGATQNVVRYDSPTFGGFSVSASWGEDDMWDVAARYAGEHAGFKVAVAAAYNELSTESFPGMIQGDTFQYFQVGGYIEHVPTGLFVYGAYGNAQFDLAAGESETYYVKAGLRERWSALGHTVLYGEYENNQADGNAFVSANLNGGNAAVRSSDFDLWGLGVVQEIDAAAMSVWVSYRHIEYSDNSTRSYEDFQYVKAGALINF